MWCRDKNENSKSNTYNILRDFKLTKRQTSIPHHCRIITMHIHGFQQYRYGFLFDSDVEQRSLTFGAFHDVKQRRTVRGGKQILSVERNSKFNGFDYLPDICMWLSVQWFSIACNIISKAASGFWHVSGLIMPYKSFKTPCIISALSI